MAQIRFAPVFFAGEEDIYFFIDTLGFGEESVVQRVLHVNTGETRVRKVSRYNFSESDSVFQADIENKALRIIQGSSGSDSLEVSPLKSETSLSPPPPSERSWRDSSPGTTDSAFLASPPQQHSRSSISSLSGSSPPSSPPSSPSSSRPPQSLVPNIMKLYSTEDVLMKLTPTARYARVSYLELYNGGDLGEFRNICRKLNLAVPGIFVLRLILQLSQALQFMYTRNPAILHCDLHRGNVFLHWLESADMPVFYIGDFGLARLRHSKLLFEDGITGPAPLNESEAGEWDKKDILSLLELVSLFPVELGMSATLLQKVVTQLEVVVGQLSGATQPRDLSSVISLVASFDTTTGEGEAEMSAIKAAFVDRVSARARQPLYHASVEEVLEHYEELHGPFNVAEVGVIAGNPQFIKMVSLESYHIPAEGDGE